MISLAQKCWIEEVRTVDGSSFRIVFESILHPGSRNASTRLFPSLVQARRYTRRQGYEVMNGSCPLDQRGTN